ncbi:MAG TPA: EAL domain-containing protein [Beijerinckiaceae bacterium]|jgi:diguanylate cyclase (GGDEF)-like protein|nr:EAL domain-containing protein [Beijerinckiaceae bacterium]
MITVLGCIATEHNIWLVLVAAIVCSCGAWATMSLFHRAYRTSGQQHAGWLFLTAVAAGASIWSTHFIAMLAYEPAAPVELDPVLTIVSLLVAVVGTALGFAVASKGRSVRMATIGGAVVGLGIAAMHYTGMVAYRVQGIVHWQLSYLIASIVLAIVLSALALYVAARNVSASSRLTASGIFVLAIVSLHFTAMTAFRVEPILLEGAYTNPDALHVLAFAVAIAALIIVGTGLTSYLIDDQVRIESNRRLRHMALNDSLTGLPNRVSFHDHLDREISWANATNGKFALVGIDLDRFKEINDLRGHKAGDEALKILARRMASLIGKDEFVARLGGDEFSATLRVSDSAHMLDFLTQLEKVLFEPVTVEDFEVATGASIGVALYPDNADSKEMLISNADLAMYRAKAEIARAICFYDQSMDETVRQRRILATELRAALEQGELDVHYQMQATLATGAITGYEALLRWKHPVRGLIPPAEFIPLAEENGLIVQIGEWVLRTACRDAANWEPPYKVAVNLSPVQFKHPDLPKLILEILVETGLPASRLELELTESAIISDKVRSLHMLRQIKALGVEISLDDFGTGYSSLDTLKTFPFDKIKLDRSFMSEIETSPQSKAIMRAVLALGEGLQIPVLAEGIETDTQLAVLNAEGCNEGQGYYFGHPAPLGHIVSLGQLTLKGRGQSELGSLLRDAAKLETPSIPIRVAAAGRA